jgi:hypothetical protein
MELVCDRTSLLEVFAKTKYERKTWSIYITDFIWKRSFFFVDRVTFGGKVPLFRKTLSFSVKRVFASRL